MLHNRSILFNNGGAVYVQPTVQGDSKSAIIYVDFQSQGISRNLYNSNIVNLESIQDSFTFCTLNCT